MGMPLRSLTASRTPERAPQREPQRAPEGERPSLAEQLFAAVAREVLRRRVSANELDHSDDGTYESLSSGDVSDDDISAHPDDETDFGDEGYVLLGRGWDYLD